MLNDIISNDFIDDRLTKFLNILQEPPLNNANQKNEGQPLVSP